MAISCDGFEVRNSEFLCFVFILLGKNREFALFLLSISVSFWMTYRGRCFNYGREMSGYFWILFGDYIDYDKWIIKYRVCCEAKRKSGWWTQLLDKLQYKIRIVLFKRNETERKWVQMLRLMGVEQGVIIHLQFIRNSSIKWLKGEVRWKESNFSSLLTFPLRKK